jgi:signal transduction histidine kinase
VPGAAALTSEMRFDCWSSSASGDSFWFTNNSPRQGAHVIYRLRELRGAPQYLPHFIPELSGKIWQLREEVSGGERTLWICGANGLVRVALDQVFQPPVRYATVLRADGVSDGQRLPPLREPLEFEFAAPRFQNRAPVEFQTRLAGYDRTWLPWSADRKRAFNQLSAGDYTFEVRARDADGQLSAPTALSFSVLPAWWRTWWCATLEVLAVITAVAAATRWLAQRALKRRLARLEAESAVERERLRLARDLHDEVGSGLGRVILFAGEAERMKTDPGQLDAALGRVRDTAQELVQHAREIVWAVTPQNDTVGSLIERLGDYADQGLRAAGIACRFELDPNPPPLPLSSEARHSLFLAVKEALHNTLKYAAATEVRLEARVVAGCLTIVLADNGCGFAPGERRGSGHGLGNIAARAEALGGSAEIVSEVGKGTRVTLRVPIAGST